MTIVNRKSNRNTLILLIKINDYYSPWTICNIYIKIKVLSMSKRGGINDHRGGIWSDFEEI